MQLPKELTTVTPISKGLALSMFIFLPFMTFLLGMQYPKLPKTDYVSKEVVVKVTPTQKSNEMIERCGPVPEDIDVNTEKFNILNGPVWSPDCRHIAWSIWQSGTGLLQSDKELTSTPKPNRSQASPSIEGIYLYYDITKKTMKIYSPNKVNQTPVFGRWINRNILLFSAGDDTYQYDVNTKVVREYTEKN